MSIVPEAAIPARSSGIVVRPLQPPLQRTLALIQHRSKPDEPALEIVRNALLMLRTGGEIESMSAPAAPRAGKRSRRSDR